MNTILLLIAIAILAGAGSYLGARIAISQKRFKIHMDKEKGEAYIEPVSDPKKAEFIEDATAEQLDEMNQEPSLKRFLKGFAKPTKEE